MIHYISGTPCDNPVKIYSVNLPQTARKTGAQCIVCGVELHDAAPRAGASRALRYLHIVSLESFTGRRSCWKHLTWVDSWTGGM